MGRSEMKKSDICRQFSGCFFFIVIITPSSGLSNSESSFIPFNPNQFLEVYSASEEVRGEAPIVQPTKPGEPNILSGQRMGAAQCTRWNTFIYLSLSRVGTTTKNFRPLS